MDVRGGMLGFSPRPGLGIFGLEGGVPLLIGRARELGTVLQAVDVGVDAPVLFLEDLSAARDGAPLYVT
jgi:hypothetical protein